MQIETGVLEHMQEFCEHCPIVDDCKQYCEKAEQERQGLYDLYSD